MRKFNNLPAVNERIMHRRVRPFKLPAADLNLKALGRLNQRVPQYVGKDARRARMQIEQSLTGLIT